LLCQNLKNAAGRQRDPAIGAIHNDLKQLVGSIAALGRNDPELGQCPRIALLNMVR
jgi:hypothetical protein